MQRWRHGEQADGVEYGGGDAAVERWWVTGREMVEGGGDGGVGGWG